MIDFKKTVGKKIKEIRLAKNITQEVLAEKVGVEPTTVSYWEKGKNAITFTKLPLIADALGVPLYKIFISSDFKSDPSALKNMLDAMTNEELAIAESVIKLIFISR